MREDKEDGVCEEPISPTTPPTQCPTGSTELLSSSLASGCRKQLSFSSRTGPSDAPKQEPKTPSDPASGSGWTVRRLSKCRWGTFLCVEPSGRPPLSSDDRPFLFV